MIYGVWYGGSKYPGSGDFIDLEEFVDLEHALEEFETRFHSGRSNLFNFVNSDTRSRDATPAVDHTSYMDIWNELPVEGQKPDARLVWDNGVAVIESPVVT